MSRRRIILLTFTLLFFTACAGQAIPPALDPQTALENSIKQFDSLQSFTVTEKTTMTGEKETSRITAIALVDQSGQISLQDSQTTSQNMPRTRRLCVKTSCYQIDDTGLLKPVSGEYKAILPAIESLGFKGTDLLKAAPVFMGEEEFNGENAFKYEITATGEMIKSKLESLNGVQTYFSYRYLEPLPHITLFVHARNGHLLRQVEVFNRQLTYEFMGKKTVSQTHDEITVDYSGWDETSITLPDFVQADDREWQNYSGKYADKVVFEFPRIFSLNEQLGFPSLKTPSGSRMDFQIFDATIAAITPVENSTLNSRRRICEESARVWLKNRISGFKAVEKTEWIETDRLSFCKVWISKDKVSEVNYLFNEPLELAWANKRILPTTFRIIIQPSGSDDAGSLFWDVIQTIKLPNMK